MLFAFFDNMLFLSILHFHLMHIMGTVYNEQ